MHVLGVLIHHPGHDLGVRVDVGRGHVDVRADELGVRTRIGAAQALQFAAGQFLRVAHHAALPAAKRQVQQGALPGHPGCQGTHGVDSLIGVETDAALGGAFRVVVLDAEGLEDPDGAVIHAYGDMDVHFAHRLPENGMDTRIQVQ